MAHAHVEPTQQDVPALVQRSAMKVSRCLPCPDTERSAMVPEDDPPLVVRLQILSEVRSAEQLHGQLRRVLGHDSMHNRNSSKTGLIQNGLSQMATDQIIYVYICCCCCCYWCCPGLGPGPGLGWGDDDKVNNQINNNNHYESTY